MDLFARVSEADALEVPRAKLTSQARREVASA
jgi:hypothetical protein